jgi:hypothetical protein
MQLATTAIALRDNMGVIGPQTNLWTRSDLVRVERDCWMKA